MDAVIERVVARLVKEAGNLRFQGQLAGMAFRDRYERDAEVMLRAAEIVRQVAREEEG